MIRVVLVRPKRAENLGAIARAMKNFGVSDWVAVSPQELDREAAKLVATQSRELLDSLRVVDTLDEAIGDCVWVVGTSPRVTRRGMRRLDPRDVAVECVTRRVDGPVAIVFGDESSGLRNEELERVHAVSALPTDEAQPSVNLAQAVLLYLYEVRQAQRATDARPALRPVAAQDADLERLHALFTRVLGDSGFLHEDGDAVVRELMDPLRRSRATKREASLWTAVLANLEKKLRR